MKIIKKGDEKEIRNRYMGIVECDWCHREFPKENTRFWPTGARVCFSCFESEDRIQKIIMKEFVQEMRHGHGDLGIVQ